MSDIVFFCAAVAWFAILGVIFYLKGFSSSKLARFFQRPEPIAVILFLLLCIPFIVHLNNEGFFVLVLAIFLLPLVFCPL
ncbi:MAG: hypothetical protein ACJ8R9_22030 [Steroidobacteraceae bacterium]